MANKSARLGARERRLWTVWLAAVAVGLGAAPAWGYVPTARWTTTASGSTGSTGDPITLTWSIVPDGVSIPGESASNLVSFLDSTLGAGVGGADLTQRPWFNLFQDSFDRWSELGGITFVYEPADDQSALSGLSGRLGVRSDVRIGGANIDGANGTLAYTYLPNDGDMVVDTSDTAFFRSSTNNYLQLRNTIMHELGHAFGLNHINSSSDELLMEPYINTSFDGPQLDDIRGIQGQYGDVFEKSNSGAGNDVITMATSLGAIAAGSTRVIGASAASGQYVGADETDFVSIANTADADFFSFTVSSASLVDLTLTPLGGVFMQGVEGGAQSSFDANSRNDLALALYASDQTTLLGTASSAAAGQIESLADIALSTAGTYFVRVTGASANVQLYQLSLSVAAAPLSTGDFDGNGVVDGADLLVWQRAFNQTGTNLAADGNGDHVVNAADLALWKQQFGESASVASIAAIPEPSAMILSLAGLALERFSRFRRRRSFAGSNRSEAAPSLFDLPRTT